MTLRLDAYQPQDAEPWNRFVAASRNGSFLFDRGFMGYHADRFADASLIARQDQRIVALLPAHRSGDTLCSHGGLSYGGWVLDERCGQREVLALFELLLRQLGAQGVRRLQYKTMPSHFQRRPAEEDRYALFRLGARWWRCEVLSVIAPAAAGQRSEGRRYALRRARGVPAVELREDACWDRFWPLLSAVLAQRHGVRPVHSVEEIQLLASRFPQHIRLATAWHGDEIAAGAVFFETDRVIRAQYLAAGALGRSFGLLDLLLDAAIERAQAGRRWFDFGVSTENGGATLNPGLVAFKESFGARTLVHDAFELDIP